MEHQIREYESLLDLLDDLEREGIEGIQRVKAVNRFISLRARQRDIPVSGTFELTPLCNFDCKMCYVHLSKDQLKEQGRLLTIDEWKSIMKQAVDAGMMYASLTGGECLTYPGFKEVYLYLLSLGIQPSVLTNGSLLTDEMVAFFTQNPPESLQITLYGSDEDSYEGVCGIRAFSSVLKGIERAKKANLNLTITITPNKYTQKNVEALLELLHELDVFYAIGDTMLQARPETGREYSQFAVDYALIEELNRIEDVHLRTKTLPRQAPLYTRYYPKGRQNPQGLPCGGAHSSFHVNWRGQICPCIAFSSSVHCSILDSGFLFAWNSIRNAMNQYKLPKECRECDIRDYCQVCPGERCLGKLNGEVNKAVCEKMHRRFGEGKISMATECLEDIY